MQGAGADALLLPEVQSGLTAGLPGGECQRDGWCLHGARRDVEIARVLLCRAELGAAAPRSLERR